jgi:HEPN domain-containing protein
MNEPRRIDPIRWEEAARWLVFVDEDMRVVEVLMANQPIIVRGAAFHCQQAVEKMAKAVLVAMGADVPKIHDVYELSWLVQDHDIEIGQAIRELANVTTWATVVRYPDVEANIAPSANDIRFAFERLTQLRRRIGALNSDAQ